MAQWRVPGELPPEPRPRPEPRRIDNLIGVDTDEELRSVVSSNAKSSRLVIVDFGAQWCDHCKAALPAFVKMTQQYTAPLYVLADVDRTPETSQNIRFTPTFQFFKKGRKVDEVTGTNQQLLKDHIWLHSDD
mmetsp:Transcript_1813/g.1999  ORF Transcript_1813/g.1999 Transcript_1813/m.1999 type:complete len:132 (-) Transcript_1813:274-669(-)|eukprot:CAMPEP_0197855236 /NCGR_PEP_ID=MMETSP1438-20131217/26227_1 /TAXON_ID=1461541 /ORGANISM="Pterosperma sp., Strain CCMP1384" /LENGTH=131 /DNA_ID=CAMNT_0043470269 /DNA_START=460 /DNA_END=855 /DNA_ORIENTATION=-